MVRAAKLERGDEFDLLEPEAFDLLPENAPPFELPPPPHGQGPFDLFDDSGPTRVQQIPQIALAYREALVREASQPRLRVWSKVPRMAGGALAAITLLALIPVPSSTEGEALLLDPIRTSLSVPKDGELFELLAAPGEVVKKGQVLLRIDDGHLGQRLLEARRRVTKLDAEVENLRRAATPGVVRDAERALELARYEVEAAEAEVERAHRLFEQGLEGAEPWRNALRSVERKRGALDSAAKELEALRKARDGSRLLQAEDELRDARRALADVEEQLRAYSVISPVDGVVISAPSADRIGTAVQKGSVVLEVEDRGQIAASIEVGSGGSLVEAGQPVLVELEGQPHGFAGTIRRVEESSGSVRAEVRLDNSDRLLRSNMRGRAQIDTGRTFLIRLILSS